MVDSEETETAGKALTRVRSNTAWALAADGTQIGLTMIAFFWLGGFLGSAEFGIYAAAMALSTLAAFVGYFGSQQILMLDLSGGGSFRDLWSRLVTTVVLGGSSVALILILLQPLLLEELARKEFAAIAFSQIVFFGLSEFAIVAAQAHRQMSAAFAIRLTTGTIRLGAVALFVRFGEPTVAGWSWFALGAWGLSSIAALSWIRWFFGSLPRWSPPSIETLKRGVPFLFGMSTATILADADRPMLLRLGGENGDTAAGIYNVGYRLASLAAVPITALVRASDYDFYEAGARSREEAKRLALRMTGVSAAYGAAATVVLVAVSGFVDDVLGPSFAETTSVLRFLSPLALIKAIQIFPANALTGSGQQNLRNRSLLIAVAINLVANAILIPTHSWRGAIVATLGAEISMALLLWIFLLRSTSSHSSDHTQISA